MKKLVLSAAVSAAMLSGAAHAQPALDGNNLPVIVDSDTYTMYLSGASAAKDFIEELFTNPNVATADAICDSTKPIWKYSDSVNGKNQNAYLCDLNKANPSLSALGKTHLLIYKRSEGGSAQGVSPLVADAKGLPSAAIEFLKINNSACTTSLTGYPAAGTLGQVTCPYDLNDPTKFVTSTPDFGISDVDPLQFRGPNTPAGFAPVSAADAGLLKVQAATALTFGIPVTTSLRNALQEAQFGKASACVGDDSEACMPSLNKAQIATIFTGQLISWDQITVDDNGTPTGLFTFASNTYKPNNDAIGAGGSFPDTVHICRRVPGSGTQAQLGINFLNAPCFDGATLPAPDSGVATEDDGVTLVHAMSSSGDVTDCLNELEAGTDVDPTDKFTNSYGKRWAVGIQSLEKNADRLDDFRFVKIDGVAPTLANVANGKYFDWAEQTFQYSKTHVWDAGEQAIADAVIKSAGNPVVMAALNASFNHLFGQSGFMAVPTLHTPATDGTIDLNAPVNPYTHAREGADSNNCRAPARITGGDFTIGIQM